MTQTEIKAAEMVKQYYHLIHGPDDDFEFTMKSNQFVSGGLYSINQAKQCALIACDLLLNNLPHTDLNFRKWQSVRAEIEKL